MKKVLLCGAASLLFSSQITAQSVVGGVQANGLDMQTSPNGFISELPPAPPETQGDVYLNSDWTVADIALYQQQSSGLKQYPVKVNLKSHDIEIKIQDQVRVLSGGKVKAFTILNNKTGVNDRFKNARQYKLNGMPLRGFFKVIDSANWELLSKAQVKLVEGTYIAALDAGDKSRTWVKEEIFFFAKDFNLYQVFPSSKKFCKQFNEQSEVVRTFIKKNNLSLKDVKDLTTILNYLNEIL